MALHAAFCIGRSPGKGDAVVMCWSEGNAAAVSRHNAWKWEKYRDRPQRWIVYYTKKHRTLVERGAPAHSCVQFQAQSPPVPNLSAESTACRPAISLYPSAAVIQAANGLSPSH